MSPFPWARAMQFGFGVLRLGPTEFWALTPRELAAAIEAVEHKTRPGTSPERQSLAALMAAYPDKASTNGQ